jgi:ATP-dependent Clp protease ATP-binding subunit ClpB
MSAGTIGERAQERRCHTANLNKAINDLRQGRTADTATAENAYDALRNMPAT